MSLSDRRTFLSILLAVPLAACGFTPVYGPGGVGQRLRNQITVTAPDTSNTFDLVARLEERLGRPTSTRYLLDYDLSTSESDLAITDTDDVTRININGVLTFTITEVGTQSVLLDETVRTFAAYSTTGSTVATAAAERDAESRLMVALADQVVSRLYASAGRWP
jgi:LPS-assembly lipoprotein